MVDWEPDLEQVWFFLLRIKVIAIFVCRHDEARYGSTIATILLTIPMEAASVMKGAANTSW